MHAKQKLTYGDRGKLKRFFFFIIFKKKILLRYEIFYANKLYKHTRARESTEKIIFSRHKQTHRYFNIILFMRFPKLLVKYSINSVYIIFKGSVFFFFVFLFYTSILLRF